MTLKPWVGDVVGLMHCNRISGQQLAEHLGVTREYVSMILNGKREPVGAEEMIRNALSEIIALRGVTSE